MAEAQKYVRATAGFVVQNRGVVNPGETVGLLRGEAMDVVSASRGDYITPAEYQQGPIADFKPKDAEGKVIDDAWRKRHQEAVAAAAGAASGSEKGRRSTLTTAGAQ